MTTPDYLKPFILPTSPSTMERHGSYDLYLPEADEPRPAIVVIHGGPVPEGAGSLASLHRETPHHGAGWPGNPPGPVIRDLPDQEGRMLKHGKEPRPGIPL